MRSIFRKLCILPVLALVVLLSGQHSAQAVGSCTCYTNQDCYLCTGGHPDSVACYKHRCIYLPS
jgi:hypothetical protein